MRAKQKANKDLLMIYEACFRARYLEKLLYSHWKSFAPWSLFSGFGAELAPAVLSAALLRSDHLFPQYRGFSSLIARGVDARSIAAEVFGKQNGTTLGIGDSFSFRDETHNIEGGAGSLGGAFSVALGLAMAKKKDGGDDIVALSFGDGESSRTVFGGALNMAKLWELPILFVCYNNGLSISTQFSEMHSTPSVLAQAKGYAIAGEVLSEGDAFSLYERTRVAVELVRSGGSPYFLEISQRRFRGHSTNYEVDPSRFIDIPDGEDPLSSLAVALMGLGVSGEQLEAIRQQAFSDAMLAVEHAKKGERVSTDIFQSIYREDV